MFDTEQIKCAPDRVIDHVFDGFGPWIESRHRRHDDCTDFRRFCQGPQMTGVQRALAHHEDEAPAFLERDVRGAGQQCLGRAAGDLSGGFDGTWCDDHAQGDFQQTEKTLDQDGDEIGDMGEGLLVMCQGRSS